ncbi:type I-E CRISPR-associated protein Cse2/CasB [Sorangium sp. So ce513]|uniref:type I-E CRISPR-associated protein Cse2/CasB n=1 Tax=Sorangium sp. So ce513 TaxID=3133315 RepID=UPI003F6013C6
MTDVRKTEDDHIARFIAHLRKLAKDEDRGALAALRRSLQDRTGIAPAACPHVDPWLPRNEDPYRDRAFFLVGALFALHPDPDGEGVSLGDAFWAINDDQKRRGAGDNESLRQRFVALLDAHAEDLPNHLRNAVSLVRSKGKRLDWDRLLRDVLAWRSDSRHIQRRLAREFWNAPHDALASEGEISR